MKKATLSLTLILAVFVTFSHARAGSVPPYINYQGYLTDAQGNPIATGMKKLQFNIYSVATGGTAVWGPWTIRTMFPSVVNGRFNLIIGNQDERATPQPLTTAFSASPLYLGIKVAPVGTANMVPVQEIPTRQMILSAPYAMAVHGVGVDPTSGVISQKSQPVMIGNPYENLVIQNNTAVPNNQVDIGADYIVADGVYLKNVNLTVDLTLQGANGLDTGAEAISTWYYIWCIHNPATATTAGLLSASSTAPTMPAGYIMKRRLGAIYNDNTGNFRIIYQNGNRVITTQTDIGVTITSTYAPFSFAAHVPSRAKKITGYVNVWFNGPTAKAAEISSSADSLGYFQVGGNNGGTIAPFSLLLKTPQTLYCRGGNVTALTILLSGWEY